MQMNFFEEYYSDKNLSKLNLVDFPTILYLGCEDIHQFLKFKQKIEKEFRQVIQVIYWPILKLSEGYWLSAFTKTNAIRRIISEMKSTDDFFPVLWDAELPSLNKKLFITELPHIFKNRRLIHQILLRQFSQHPLIVAEFPRSDLKQFVSILGGASFSFTNYHRLDMLYSSMMKISNKEKYIRHIIRENKRKHEKYSVGLGLLDKGEGDPTPLITVEELDRDLSIARQEGVEEVVLYRLGGLNKNYLKVLKQYV